MKVKEFSDSFDALLNSYSGKTVFGEDNPRQSIALDEYEKSLFLTKAQEELVLSLYTGRNTSEASFEGTEEMRRYLSNLVAEKVLKPIANSNGLILGMTSNSKFFTLPEDLWFITYEEAVLRKGKCGCNSTMKVYPVKQDEYQNIKDNPFRGANDRRALRLDLSEGNVEIVCRYLVTEYYIRYIRKIPPIILTDLPDGMSIDNESKVMGCKLHEALHKKILERAVVLALQSKGIRKENEN